MGKGALKFGGKSGTLPIPRQIFKQPYKHQVYVKPVNSGYADGILHPKGTSRDFVPPKTILPEQRLSKTVHPPKKQYTESELSKMPVDQRYKIKNAELRRQFLKESYETEVARLERVSRQARDNKEQEERLKRDSARHQQTKAELYTIPTVESYLQGPFIRQRTPQEQENLKLKRATNRLQQELNIKSERSMKLLELYNAAADFAITESKLELMVDEAFSDKKQFAISNVSKSSPEKLDPMPSASEFDSSLKDLILGNVNKGPSFDVVEDTLNGATDELHEQAEKALAEQQTQLKLEAEETQKKLLQLQEEMSKGTEQQNNTN